MEPFLYPLIPSRAVALRNEVCKTRAARAEAGGAEYQQFYARGEAIGYAQALRVGKFVYSYLNYKVAHRNEAVLQHYGERENEQRFEHRNSEDVRLFVGRHLFESQEDEYYGEYAGRALRYERSPRHALDAPGTDHYYVQHDVAHRRDYQEYEGRTAVAERGKNTRAEIVKNEEGQTEVVYVEVSHALFQRLGGGFERRKQRFAAAYAHNQQNHGEHGEGNKSREDGRLYARIVLCAEQAGHEHRAARIRAER